MSVFFEYPTDMAAAGKGSILATRFSEGDHPILAVSTSNGDCTLFHEEGETITIEVHQTTNSSADTSPLPASFRRASECRQLAWRPRSLHPLLACGWQDGALSLWAEKDRAFTEQARAHSSAVTLVQWAPDGCRLLTGDANGTLCVWSVDARYRLTCVSKYQARGAVTHITFRQPAVPASTAAPACPPFFFGTVSGCVCFADDANHFSALVEGGAAITFLHYSPVGDFLSVVDRDAMLFHYSFNAAGGLVLERSVKLSIKGDGSTLQLALCGSNLIVGANHENLVRFWSLDREESYVLPFDGKHMAEQKDVITCLAFNPRKRVLGGGTAAGRIVFWRFVGSSGDGPSGVDHADPRELSPDDWEGLPAMESSASISTIQWGPGEGLLALNNEENVSIVLETVMQFRYCDGHSAVQMTADSVQVQRANDSKPVKFTAGIRVKGLDINDNYAIVWNGKRAELRSITNTHAELIAAFPCRASHICLYGSDLYCATGGRVEICNLQGTVTRVLPMAEHEGAPVAMYVNGHFLAVATDKGRLALFDLSKQGETRVLVPHFDATTSAARSSSDSKLSAHIHNVRVNGSGTKLGFLCRLSDSAGLEQPDTRIHVYDVETDRLHHYDFGPRRFPVLQHFDAFDPRLLAVESKPIEAKYAAPEVDPLDDTRVNHLTAEVTTLFCTSTESGLAMQDSFALDPTKDTLMAVSVPHFLFLSRPDDDGSNQLEWQPKLKQTTMRDFVGLENVGAETKRDLLAFSFAVTVGNMDEAYRCVKKIGGSGGGEAIWENLAQQCVKTKRLDVAELCLGNLNNARGVRAVREAKLRHREPEVAIAEVALQLHLPDEAERLYKECGRFDKLAAFYAAAGRWKDALATASRHDRIHLRALHHQYARHLEQSGDTQAAIAHFELAGTAKSEVPRMLCDAGMMTELHHYVDKHPSDHQLSKWWAQHCESSGDLDSACRYYQRAGETLALVRVHCFRSDVPSALAICAKTRDAAACYHLARQMESAGDVERAIELYSQAHRFNHAIRLASEAGLEVPLMSAALQATDAADQLRAAQYFESCGALEKAAMLYERAGKLHRALDLCFQAELVDALRQLTDKLESSSDAELLTKCATFFQQHGQYVKAAAMLASAGQRSAALALCESRDIAIDEAMAERLTPPKPTAQATADEKKARESLLLALASLCRSQGAYQLACKKFTQAGDSVAAMQCLIKSEDTEKIVYYATMAKKAEVWILAANHLSALDWRADPAVLSSIVSFYSKAKAWAQLSSFFDHCTCVEIDEYRDYDRALTALRESSKAAIKAKLADKERKMKELTDRIANIEAFLQARNRLESDATGMVRACHELVDRDELPGGVRLGDVFALLIEFHASQGQFPAAMACVDQMAQKRIPIEPYIDADILQQVRRESGRTSKQCEEQKHDDLHEREREHELGQDDHGGFIDEELADL